MLNNFDLLYSLFNPFVYQQAKNNITDLEYYFQTNPNTMANPLVDELLKAIKTYDYDVIGEPLFQSIFAKLQKNPIEAGKILGDMKKWVEFNKEQIQPALKYLDDVCASVVIQRANKFYQASPSEFIKYIKNYNFQSTDIDVFSSTKFNEIDMNSILAENNRGSITTNVDFINRVFSPHNGIERGQLGIICAPPGVGKSLLSMSLALWMASKGEKVIYYCLGDMNMRDFIIRMGAVAFGISFAEAYNNIEKVYRQLVDLVGSNLEISINPAGVVTADEMVQMTLDGHFTVAVVDYDGNIAGAQEGESMYNTFGTIYNTLTRLNLEGILTLVCAQPKVFAWEREIEMSDIGESSKKQHSADFIITLSNVNPTCPNHLYVMKFPKARRGKVGSRAYFIRVEGRFIEIPKGLYDQLRQITEEKDYTEAEINSMTRMFIQNRNQIEKDVQAKMNGGPQPKPLINPFTSN